MKHTILNQTEKTVLIELPSHKRTLKIRNQPYFLLLPKIRLNLYFINNQVKCIYICFTNDQNQILVPKLNNVSNFHLCCPLATAKNLDDLIKQQIDLIFNTEFTQSYYKPIEFYEKWVELSKQNKMPEFEVCDDPFQIIFTPECIIEQFELQFQLVAVKQNGLAIIDIPNPSEQVQLAAVKQNGYAIKYIQNPSEQVQLAAVKQIGSAIFYIKNPSEQVQLEAVKQYGYAIQYIKNPSEQVQLEAIKQTGWTIQYIQNPSETVQLEAVKQDGRTIEFIQNPSETVQLEAVKQIKAQ